jgi:hypothetical protein
MFSRLGIVLVVGLGFSGCVDTDSNTDLVTAGPPEIAQVRLNEAFTDVSGASEVDRVFAFGTQPTATAQDEHAVTTATATMQSLRVISDQLLRGNRLEQIECRDIVALDNNGNPTTFSDVPDDATPDDIAKCAVSDAALDQSCVGSMVTCICQIQAGCDGVAFGDPVGVLDNNFDGAADKTQLKPGIIQLACGPDGSIPVPVDPSMSYWNPSGNQLVPAEGGFDAMGPAIVLVPEGGIMPTNVTCGLTFDPSVVDQKDLQMCAVPGGRPADCTGRLADCPEFLANCTPGDVSAFSFGVEALSISSPIIDGQMDVPLTLPLFFNANAPLLAASVANITFSPTPPGGVAITLSSSTSIQMVFATGLAPSTMYTITFPTTLTDTFGQGLPAPLVVTFTSASM